MTEIEKVTNNQAKARSIYNSLIKDNIFYTGISKNLAIALIELGIDSSTTDRLSVEKLQEQLNTAKKALTEIAVIPTKFDDGGAGEIAVEIAHDALAAIGGDDDRE
ncbi:hypothetical protein [Lactococcus cremoris]|uniref:hypothetical protein n=1 Tax=Lactococcus lactis subsp. cremoris TaxID=1359 RepID=UPI00218215AF|nr:hypothetical protein [Lactococcus cremoris]